MYSRILVPLDGSTTAEQVLPYARSLAQKMNLGIELLSVLDLARLAAQLPAVKARLFDPIIEDALRQSSGYLQDLAATFPRPDVRYVVEKGIPEEVIIEKAAVDQAILVAMASHGRSGVNRFLLGSVAEKVLRGTVNPLLLVRAAEERKSTGEASMKCIIAPLDGSEIAERVLPTVVALARQLGAPVVLFRAYQVPYTAHGNEALYARYYDEMLSGVRDEAVDYLEKKAGDLRTLGLANVSCAAQHGFGGDEIIRFSQTIEDNLLVMASHGRSGFRRWMLGSVSEAVARHSTGPVLIIRVAG